MFFCLFVVCFAVSVYHSRAVEEKKRTKVCADGGEFPRHLNICFPTCFINILCIIAIVDSSYVHHVQNITTYHTLLLLLTAPIL